MTDSAMAPEDALRAAQEFLSRAGRSTAGLWPRAAALLGRQALEGALDRFWALRAPGVDSCSMKAQLLTLPFYIGDEKLAEDAAHAWWAFTRATHEHAYELPPTHEELKRWLDEVHRLIATTELLGLK